MIFFRGEGIVYECRLSLVKFLRVFVCGHMKIRFFAENNNNDACLPPDQVKHVLIMYVWISFLLAPPTLQKRRKRWKETCVHIHELELYPKIVVHIAKEKVEECR